jgi:hypothetical protein
MLPDRIRPAEALAETGAPVLFLAGTCTEPEGAVADEERL